MILFRGGELTESVMLDRKSRAGWWWWWWWWWWRRGAGKKKRMVNAGWASAERKQSKLRVWKGEEGEGGETSMPIDM